MIIYTDGGCFGNPGIGGWAFVIVEDGKAVHTGSGAVPNTTNNRMELGAIIKALQYAYSQGKVEVDLYTDSQYAKNGMTDWIHSWKKKNWKTANNKPVKNQKYWLYLDDLSQKVKINWHWVKGHNGNEFNEMCDELVKSEMTRLKDQGQEE